MKKIILVLLYLINLYADDYKFNLVDFAMHVAKVNQINILIPEELKNTEYSFSVNKEVSSYIGTFRKTIESENLQLLKTDDFYFVRKKPVVVEKSSYRSLKLHFISFEDIENFMKVYEPKNKDSDFSYQYVKTSKLLIVKSTFTEFDSISNMLKLIDTVPEQMKLKITIIDTDIDKIKQLGTDASILSLKTDSNFFFNLVTYPFTVKNVLGSVEKSSFYTFIKFLNSSGSTHLLSSPTLTIIDEKITKLSVLDNVPYTRGSTIIDGSNVSTAEVIEYKDVGLDISVKPHFFDDSAYLDLKISHSSVKSNESNLLTTNSRDITQSFRLKKNKIMILTGINRKEVYKNEQSIPLLRDIPYLKWLFKYESTSTRNTNLSIIFELIEDDLYKNDLDLSVRAERDSENPLSHFKKVSSEGKKYVYNK